MKFKATVIGLKVALETVGFLAILIVVTSILMMFAAIGGVATVSSKTLHFLSK